MEDSTITAEAEVKTQIPGHMKSYIETKIQENPGLRVVKKIARAECSSLSEWQKQALLSGEILERPKNEGAVKVFGSCGSYFFSAILSY